VLKIGEIGLAAIVLFSFIHLHLLSELSPRYRFTFIPLFSLSFLGLSRFRLIMELQFLCVNGSRLRQILNLEL